jgi:hypothetical protein
MSTKLLGILIEGSVLQVRESFSFGLLPKAKSLLHKEAGYSLCSSFKALIVVCSLLCKQKFICVSSFRFYTAC